MVKLFLGGSPCTHWSCAKTKNRETEPSGIGWELFQNYLIGKEKYQPDYFLYENNKSMSSAIKEQITKELGVEPVLINSSLVSAQNRQRLYWTNIPGVTQPADCGLLLRDVLESGICWAEKSYTLKAQYYKNGIANFVPNGGFCATGVAEPVRVGTIKSGAKSAGWDSQANRVYSTEGKSVTIGACGGEAGAKSGLYAVPYHGEINDDISADGRGIHSKYEKVFTKDQIESNHLTIYEVHDGQITITGKRYPIKLADGFYIIRKLTVGECKRLQTVPDNYVFPVSNTQAYKMLGNGWTVDVIAHILSHIPAIRTEPVEVFSMYDGMSCGRIALNKLGANIVNYYATEIDKYAIKTTQTNFPETIQLGDAFQVRDDHWTWTR